MCDITMGEAGFSSGIYRLEETVVIPVGDRCDLAMVNDRTATDVDGAGGRDVWCDARSDVTGSATGSAEERRASVASGVLSSGDGDGIQIICRNDSCFGVVPTSDAGSVSETVTRAEADLSALVDAHEGDFSSIVEIDGDRFVIHSRLAGSEEDEHDTSRGETRVNQDSGYDETGVCDGDDENSGMVMGPTIAEQCRRFFESRLLSRWPDLTESSNSDSQCTPSAKAETTEKCDTDKDFRPESADSGRESGSEGLGSICSSSDIHGFVARSDSQRSNSSSATDIVSDSDSDHRVGLPIQEKPPVTSKTTPETSLSVKLTELQRDMRSEAGEERPFIEGSGRESGSHSSESALGPSDVLEFSSESGADASADAITKLEGRLVSGRETKPQSSLEMKMTFLRHEMGALMRQDNELFRQLLALNDSIEALRFGAGSLSPASSLSSLAEEEEDMAACELSMCDVTTRSDMSGTLSRHVEMDASSPATDDLSMPDVPACGRLAFKAEDCNKSASELTNLAPLRPDSGSGKSFLKDLLHASGISNWGKIRISNLLSSSSTHQTLTPTSH